jgi:hypothetical protein
VKTWLVLVFCGMSAAQDFTGRGFLDSTAWFYPQTVPGDSGQAVGQDLLQYDAFLKLSDSLRLAGGIDAEVDTHEQVARTLHLSWWDREEQRPAFEVRRLSASYTKGEFTIEIGKQLIRWGRTDILAPTDRFAPRDYLNVVDADVLAVMAARVTYQTQSDSLDLVYSPVLTPIRTPLLNQRWAGLPTDLNVQELPPNFPGGPQFGLRWNHTGGFAEYSLSFYNGHDNQPLYQVTLPQVQRFYPQMRMYGGDTAIPLAAVTLRAEAAYFTSTNPRSDEYVLYVLQVERQAGEWQFVAGYTGQIVTERGTAAFSFSPERGFSRAFVAHASYTIDTTRSVSLEAVVRQNGQGLWLKSEYTQAFGQHWRATAGFLWIYGSDTDFLGRYHRNSNGILGMRYSF